MIREVNRSVAAARESFAPVIFFCFGLPGLLVWQIAFWRATQLYMVRCAVRIGPKFGNRLASSSGDPSLS
jgi:hypothetical protein